MAQLRDAIHQYLITKTGGAPEHQARNAALNPNLREDEGVRTS